MTEKYLKLKEQIINTMLLTRFIYHRVRLTHYQLPDRFSMPYKVMSVSKFHEFLIQIEKTLMVRKNQTLSEVE